MSMVGLYN